MFQYSDILLVIYQPLYSNWAVPELAPCMLISNIDLEPPLAFPTTNLAGCFFLFERVELSVETAVFSGLTGGLSKTHVKLDCLIDDLTNAGLSLSPLPVIHIF